MKRFLDTDNFINKININPIQSNFKIIADDFEKLNISENINENIDC